MPVSAILLVSNKHFQLQTYMSGIGKTCIYIWEINPCGVFFIFVYDSRAIIDQIVLRFSSRLRKGCNLSNKPALTCYLTPGMYFLLAHFVSVHMKNSRRGSQNEKFVFLTLASWHFCSSAKTRLHVFISSLNTFLAVNI